MNNNMLHSYSVKIRDFCYCYDQISLTRPTCIPPKFR